MVEEITSSSNFKRLKNNIFRGSIPKMTSSKIIFKGKNNILFVEEGVVLENSKIVFHSNNSIVYLSKSKHVYNLDIAIYCNSVLFIGNDNYFNGVIHLIAAEERNIIIGNDGMFSYNVNVRVCDAHPIYSCSSHKRINNSKNIYIGDHCWLGFGSLILKGTKIGSGAIVGANAVISNKNICSNSSYAGNPAKMISNDVFFIKESVNNYIDINVNRSQECLKDDFIFKNVEEERLAYSVIDKVLAPHIQVEKKLEWILNNLVSNNKKNRFFIPNEKRKNLLSKLKKVHIK